MAKQAIKATRKKLSDYRFDPNNANKGTVRGTAMLEKSVEKFGAGRSLVVDAEGIIRAGNHTGEELASAGIQDVIEVETTGKEIVVVKRSDLKGDKAEAYALYDNRTAQVGIDYDPDVLLAISQSNKELNFKELFNPSELIEVLKSAPETGNAGQNNISEVYGIVIDCDSEEQQTDLLTKFLLAGLKCRALLS